jgi:SRSO17 transposase
MLEAIVQGYEELNQYLSAYRKAFRNKPQYRHFQAYIVALLIYLGSKNLAGLKRALPDGRAACSIYRFLAEMSWDEAQVEQVRWELVSRETRQAIEEARGRGELVVALLIIDDTLLEKRGKQMEGVAKFYSTKAGHQVLGHVWVTAQLVVLGHSYPVSWKLYLPANECLALGREFVSKVDLACQLVQEFNALPDTQTYVLTDSWYPSQQMLKACQSKGFSYISAVKSDRKLTLQGQTQSVSKWVQAQSAVDLVTVNRLEHTCWLTQGKLFSGHRVQMLANHSPHQPWRYLICTDLSLDVQSILRFYLLRWEVENFYRMAKHSLGWRDYQVRNLRAMQRHVLLIMVAHSFLFLQRQAAFRSDPSTSLTLGDIQRQLHTHARRSTLSLALDLAHQGHSRSEVFQILAA